jgi:hypothetical protein
MAKTITLQSGLIAVMMSDKEQEALWKELSQDVSPIGKNVPLYTPRDNKEYFIVSEKELSFEKYEAEIRANGKTIKVKYGWRHQDDKIYKAVRKAYEDESKSK